MIPGWFTFTSIEQDTGTATTNEVGVRSFARSASVQSADRYLTLQCEFRGVPSQNSLYQRTKSFDLR